ncbi:MAG: 3-phosphoshikimate 1-carboxyvinyltransferase [Sphingomonadales bacterium]|jgi:3-phosphoshikimate 1-carboxyvinyltransferase|nr:3-phosphoshikimate 1-carboxyvinyltransferase [Sphingomonadales bacterium]
MTGKPAFAPRGPLRGTARIPGDKSVSHRALMLAALAVGRSRIEGLNPGGDLASTRAALQAMGARIETGADGVCTVDGVGVGGLLQPAAPFDCGNSGTSARLLMGLVASHRIRAEFAGDASLMRRPMARVAAPLRRIGARIDRDLLPLTVEGLYPAIPAGHVLAIPSAQVKSALLLAGLNTPGLTEIVEAAPSRDHLERMLALFGADIACADGRIALRGEAELTPQHLVIPGDASAAAFLAVAALIVPGSEILIRNVGINPTRTGLYEVLREMGADIVLVNRREASNEPVADMIVRHSALAGIAVPPGIAPRMIDEYPILFVAAAFASGTTRAHGLAELRLKESDRIAGMAAGLRAIGVRVEEQGDALAVHGLGGAPLPGGRNMIDPGLDHRIAMSFAVAGLHAREAIGVANMAIADTSFPGFLSALGALAPE